MSYYRRSISPPDGPAFLEIESKRLFVGAKESPGLSRWRGSVYIVEGGQVSRRFLCSRTAPSQSLALAGAQALAIALAYPLLQQRVTADEPD